MRKRLVGHLFWSTGLIGSPIGINRPKFMPLDAVDTGIAHRIHHGGVTDRVILGSCEDQHIGADSPFERKMRIAESADQRGGGRRQICCCDRRASPRRSSVSRRPTSEGGGRHRR